MGDLIFLLQKRKGVKLTVDYSCSVQDLARLGHYRYTWSLKQEHLASCEQGKKSLMFCEFYPKTVGAPSVVDQAIIALRRMHDRSGFHVDAIGAQMKRAGFRPANLKELLFYAVQCREQIIASREVLFALGSVYSQDDGQFAPVLYGFNGECMADVFMCQFQPMGVAFVGVREVR